MILLTRPRVASERFAGQLEARIGGSARIVVAPLAEIVPTHAPVPDPDAFDFVVFTSENGAAMLGGAPRRLPCYCVGARTAEAAQGLGYEPAHVARDVSALIRHLLAHPPTGQGLYARGVQVSHPLAEALAEEGIRITETMLYRQAPQNWSGALVAEITGADVIAPLFSPHIARRFRASLEVSGLRAAAVALSPSVAAALGPDFRGEIHTCAAPDAESMCTAVEGLLDAWGKLEQAGSPS
ncbi:uroporphyrinogen-III synthase [Pseudoruegeria aquimaris]|uniref:uroporphyrinogen-III synthase n=1 Tax=Pseudoruegeria aquimaris TaxID=393663 RepID=UPI001592F033|nr:uroporphyrinogen-III synthase [Pseudoruegeria aquimaris]